jgi:hypothetical protein
MTEYKWYTNKHGYMDFGYWSDEIAASDAIWGARAIWPNRNSRSGDFPLDLLPDRQNFHGDDALWPLLKGELNGGVLEAMQARMAGYARRGMVRPDKSKEVVLFENTILKAVGNSNGSYGYFYLSVFLKPVDFDKRVTDDSRVVARPDGSTDYEGGEFRWDAPRIPAIGERITLNQRADADPGSMATVVGHAIEYHFLFLLVDVDGVDLGTKGKETDRVHCLAALRQEEPPTSHYFGYMPVDEMRADPSTNLHLPRSGTARVWVMGREWEEAPTD